jgi:hypothetical protein
MAVLLMAERSAGSPNESNPIGLRTRKPFIRLYRATMSTAV